MIENLPGGGVSVLSLYKAGILEAGGVDDR